MKDVLIRDALLIDGTGSKARAGVDVLVRRGRISRIGTSGTVRAAGEAVAVDASGKTLVPGIINLRGLAGLVRSPESDLGNFERDTMLGHLATYASYGVTTVVSPAPRPRPLLRIRREIESTRLSGFARLVTPLRTLRTGSPTTVRHPGVGLAFETIGDAAAARRAVATLAKEGADIIEIEVPRSPRGGQPPLEVARVAVERARRVGLRVAVRASRGSVAATLVRAGAHVVVGSVTDAEVGREFVSALLAADAVYVPVLCAEFDRFGFADRAEWLNDRYLRRSLLPGISSMLRGPVSVRQALDPDLALKRVRYEVAQRNLRRLAAAGVRIGFGSGSGFPGTFEGYGEYREAALLRRAGMPPAEVVRAFSTGSATALGIEGSRGSLQPGRAADLVILNANPLENIHNLRELHAVFVGGRLVGL